MTPTLADLISRTNALSLQKARLRYLVEERSDARCSNMVGKLAEYSGRGDAVENLIAELRLASALLRATNVRVVLQDGAASDLRLLIDDDVDVTVEVEHKSSYSAFSDIFYPDPDLELPLAAGERDSPSRAAARRLHAVVRSRNFLIDPWIDATLAEPLWGGKERAEQESATIAVADWLANELATMPNQSGRLVHDHARFDLTLIEEVGRITGYGPLEAYVVNDYPNGSRVSLFEWFRTAVRRKARIASRHPERRGKLHIVGLVIDEAFASQGFSLVNALLGAVTAAEGRHYRAVPPGGAALLDEAIARGRSTMIESLAFDRTKTPRAGDDAIMFDREVHENIDGVLALYYTDSLQFVPNPFSQRDLGPSRELFPQQFEPFTVPSRA